MIHYPLRSWKALVGLLVAATVPTSISYGQNSLEEVVVTARKKEENLQEVPLSITAFSADQLARKGITQLEQVADYTPGFNFEDYADNFNAAPVIRGLSQFDITQSPQNVAAFVDGVYMPRNFSFDLGSADLERLEIVKGPQSALYGRNAFSGAINYVTKRPSEEFSVDAELTVGQYDRQALKIGLGGYLVPELFGVRVWGSIDEFSGSWSNSFPGPLPGDTDRVGGHDNESYGATVVFSPNDRIELEASYITVDRFSEVTAAIVPTASSSQVELDCGTQFAALGPRFLCGEYSSNPLDYASPTSTRPGGILFDPNFFGGTAAKIDISRVDISVDITDNSQVVYQYGLVDSTAVALRTAEWNPVSPASPVFAENQQRGGNEAHSHEIRLQYDNGSNLSATVGYFRSKVEDDRSFDLDLYFRPNVTTPFAALAVQNFSDEDDIDAIFGAVEYAFSDRLTTRFEARYTTEDRQRIDQLPTTAPNNRLFEEEFKFFTPRLSLDYSLTPDTLLYGSIARGAKAGGFNRKTQGGGGGATPILDDEQSFAEETNWTYEFGAKNTFLDGRLGANFALYYIDWSDASIAAQPSNAAVPNISNIFLTIGDIRVLGLEVDGYFNITDNFTVTYAATINDPEYKDGVISTRFLRFPGACVDIVCASNGDVGGNTVQRTSTLEGVLGASYNFPAFGDWEGYVSGDMTHRNKAYISELNLGYAPARTLLDARVGLRNDRYEAFLWARNLTDEEYITNSLFVTVNGAYTGSFGDRRTWGLTLRANFD